MKNSQERNLFQLNNMKKIGLIFGGISNEHDVSVMSAKNVIENFDDNKYELVLIFWSKDNKFYHLNTIDDIKSLRIKDYLSIENFNDTFEITLLMTHGKYGEDGALQGLLETQKIKYCGCHVLSSALCMDKTVFKEYIKKHDFKQVLFLTIPNKNFTEQKIQVIEKEFNLPIFVKPANSGSSVGITKVKDFAELKPAIKEAFKHDNKVIVEEGLDSPKEIEIAVLGNEELMVSQPGELIPYNDFYDYSDKYQLNKTEIKVPAKLSIEQSKEIKKIAEKVYKLCDCKGFARIDFFIKDDKIYINEINTLPGFTKNSMYPLLIMNEGMSYKELINKIIELAL